MPKFLITLAALLLLNLSFTAADQATVPRSQAVVPTLVSSGDPLLPPDAQRAMIKQYCVGCHSDTGRAGELTLANFDPLQIERDAPIAEKMIRKLRAGMMPPPQASRRPDANTVNAFVAAVEARLDEAAAARPNPGRRTFQRLNRAEYRRAVRDLLDLDVDVDAFLPSDTISGGFDNIADVQSFSPTLMQAYLRAASQISRLAVGDRNATASPTTYTVPQTESQMRHLEGTPIGTRGGISVVHVFPADGAYVFSASFVNAGEGELYGGTIISSTDKGEQIEVSINGARAAVFDLDPWMHEETHGSLSVRTPPIHVMAGPQRVSASFLKRYSGPSDDLIAPIEFSLANPRMGKYYGVTTLPHLRDLTVAGPQTVTGVSETPSRQRIFTCRPASASAEAGCAAAIIRRLASQAYREPSGTLDVERLMRLYAQERKRSDFDTAIRLVLQGILASPRFVFRVEGQPETAAAGQTYRVSDLDLASRLSFFLWDTLPDAELLRVAGAGGLKTPATLSAQVRRMLADPRSESLATRFAHQWLRLQDVDEVSPHPERYPHYDRYLADSFVRETELFFASLVREDRSALDLLSADYSFVNERIARHYGIPRVVGDQFRRVALPPERRGILGQGSILMLTSVADRTSPVMRGKWIMEVLLGSPPPPPPPNVPTFDQTQAVSGAKLLSVRERMEQHRASPACASCHRVIDPPGLALENFDVTGQWRIKDNGVTIDPAGQLYDGTAMNGPAGLRGALLKHADVVLLSFTEHLLTYALGRRVEYFDMPTVRTIVRDAARHDNRMSAFVLGIVQSPAFQMARVEETTSGSR